MTKPDENSNKSGKKYHGTPGYPPENRDFLYPHTYDKPLHPVSEDELDLQCKMFHQKYLES